jgi:hypothetical protein
MLRGGVQHLFLLPIRGSLAARTAEALMGGMRDVLAAAGVAEPSPERLPSIDQTSTGLRHSPQSFPIPVDYTEKARHTSQGLYPSTQTPRGEKFMAGVVDRATSKKRLG